MLKAGGHIQRAKADYTQLQ